jgi:hypothetical protein
MKVPFLKKCKEAGLLNDLFEEILDKLHVIQERLMGETTSESGTKTLNSKIEPSHKPRCKTDKKKKKKEEGKGTHFLSHAMS